ncbi:MAG: L,D-transpeptidase family protein [Candidatus Cloacimonetes bacterium]|nr:L,D-transpeptidase family protein [Candidatus Cloacimonadota bacterium]
MKLHIIFIILLSLQINWATDFFDDDLIQNSDNSTTLAQDSSQNKDNNESQQSSGIIKPGTKNLNVRKGPFRSSKIIAKVDGGVFFKVINEDQIVSEYISVVAPNNKAGFVHKDYIDSVGLMVKLGVSNLRLRDGDSLDSKVIKKVQGKTKLKELSQSSDFMQVELEDQSTGYLSKKYIANYFIVKSGVSNLIIRRSNSRSSSVITKVNGGQYLEHGTSKGQSLGSEYIKVELEDGLIGYISKKYAVFQSLTSESLKHHSRYTVVAEKLLKELQVKKVFDDFKSKNQAVINFDRFFGFKYRSYLKEVIQSSPQLKEEFSEELESFLWKKPIYVYSALLDLLFDSEKMSTCGHFVLNNDYRKAYDCSRDTKKANPLVDKITGYFSDDEEESSDIEDNDDQQNPKVIIINLPEQRLRVFQEGKNIFSYRVVIGHPDHRDLNEGENSKSRVGDFKIISWTENYSNSSYPAHNVNPLKGAFGKWTAKLNDNHSQYIHGTYGNGIVSWAAIAVAPGSHGCIRSQNKDIVKLKEIAEVGTKVKKIYALTQYIKVGDMYVRQRLSNIYKYEDVDDNGIYFPEIGVLIDYTHPKDAITD